jgi:Uma2 family endonuclease
MAIAPSPPARTLEGETRLLVRNIRWETYESLVEDLGDQHVHLTYDRGDLELMSPSEPHEEFKRMIGRLIETATEELDIPIRSRGSMTFRKQMEQKGLEPDECYWIRNQPRVQGKRKVDLAIDPPPDLAVEIEITHGLLDRLSIYAALGVPEIWHHDGEVLSILLLQEDGTYANSDRSLNLPFLLPGDVDRFLKQLDTTDETSWIRSFRAWVRDEVAPRRRGPDGPR